MKLRWNIVENSSTDEITLIYDMFLGTKKLFLNNKKVLSLKKDWNRVVKFQSGSKDYKLELIPQGYEYDGVLITPEGNRIQQTVEKRVIYKAPWWLILFIIIDMIIPIISVEALRPWIIGILASYIDKRICERPDRSNKYKIIISIIISAAAWLTYFIFYLMVKNYGFNGGFIPF